MDPFSRVVQVIEVISGLIVIIPTIYGFARHGRGFIPAVGRFIYNLLATLLNILASILDAIPDWWDSWGKKFTITLVVISVIVAGVLFMEMNSSSFNLVSFLQQRQLQAQAYKVQTPGPQCDKGAGQWTMDTRLRLTCLTDRVGLNYLGDGSDFYEVYFTGSDFIHKLFPSKYSVHVVVTFPDGSDAYVGVGIHGIANKDICGQMGFIKADGTWSVYRYRADGAEDSILDQGSAPANTLTYTLDIAVQENAITLVVNGVVVTELTDKTFQTTSYVCIGMGGASNDAVTISDFEFGPIS